MDWSSRRVLAWRLSNTLDVSFCLEALETFGAPEIFNSDQGSQFTSEAFTDMLDAQGVRISMDGKGRWIDNVFIEPKREVRGSVFEGVWINGRGPAGTENLF